MNKKQFHLRSRVVMLFLAVVLTAFGWVLFDLQVVNGSYFLEQSTRKIANTETVQAARGNILDRYGRVLVSNRATYQVTLDTSLMGTGQSRNETVLALLEVCREQGVSWNETLPVTTTPPFRYTVDNPFQTVSVDESGNEKRRETQLARLVATLNLKDLPAEPSAQELVLALRNYFKVEQTVGQTEGRALVGVLCELALRSKDIARTAYVFAQDVDIDFITVVKERQLIGVRIDTATVREYNTTYAAHLLGQVGSIYQEEWEYYMDKGYSMNDIVGKDGVEQAFEDILRGTPGVKDVEYNQTGKIINESWHVDPETGQAQVPQPGDNLMLTLDIKLQEAVEQAFWLSSVMPGT